MAVARVTPGPPGCRISSVWEKWLLRSFRSRGPAGASGGGEVLVKDEGRLPTGSFKARGLAMAVSMAKAFGIEHLAMPSNGNAGAALAAYASRAGIRAHRLLSGRYS